MPDDDGWVSASELADYAYCPRAHWYARHPPPGGPARDAGRRARRGVEFHAHALSGERRRAEYGAVYWAVLVVGLLLIAAGIALVGP